MKKAVFQLEPLTCPSCIKKIETALEKMKDVENAKVLFNSGKVKVDVEAGKVSLEDLENTIEKLGYTVKSKKAS